MVISVEPSLVLLDLIILAPFLTRITELYRLAIYLINPHSRTQSHISTDIHLVCGLCAYATTER